MFLHFCDEWESCIVLPNRELFQMSGCLWVNWHISFMINISSSSLLLWIGVSLETRLITSRTKPTRFTNYSQFSSLFACTIVNDSWRFSAIFEVVSLSNWNSFMWLCHCCSCRWAVPHLSIQLCVAGLVDEVCGWTRRFLRRREASGWTCRVNSFPKTGTTSRNKFVYYSDWRQTPLIIHDDHSQQEIAAQSKKTFK